MTISADEIARRWQADRRSPPLERDPPHPSYTHVRTDLRSTKTTSIRTLRTSQAAVRRAR